MRFNKSPGSPLQFVFIAASVGYAVGKTASWIFDNSGLSSDTEVRSEFAQLVAKILLVMSIATLYWVVCLYAMHLFEKYRGRKVQNNDSENK